MIRLGKTYDNYVLFIIFIKILFVLFASIEFLLKIKIKFSNKTNTNLINIYNNISFYKEVFEFLFIVSTALICIIVFYPYYSEVVIIDKTTRTLLFIYGFIILIKANWSILISSLPKWFIHLQNLIGKK